MHNFTLIAQDTFTFRSTSAIYGKFYRNLASTNVDNKTFYNVLLISQTVMLQSLQPKGEFESMCGIVFFYHYSIR